MILSYKLACVRVKICLILPFIYPFSSKGILQLRIGKLVT